MEQMKVKLWGKKQVWIAIFAGMMFLFTGSITNGNTNTVFPYFSTVFGWNQARMFLMVSIGGYCTVLSTLIFGQLVTKVGARRIIFLGLAGGGISALLMGVSNSESVFMATIILNFIFAGAYQAAAVNCLVTNWFPKQKGIVLGWSTMGMVLGNATYAPYITKAFDAIGVGVTYSMIACVFWLFAVLTIVAVKDYPEQMGTYPDNNPEEAGLTAAVLEQEAAKYKSPFTYGRLLKMKETWQFVLGYGLEGLGITAIVSRFVPRLIESGYSPALAAFALMISGLLALPASWFFGLLDQKLGTKTASVALAVCNIVTAVAALLHGHGLAFVWISAIGFAMSQGATANLAPSMIGTWFGRWDFAAASRLLTPLQLIVTTGGLSLVSIAMIYGINFTGLYIISLIAIVVGAIFLISIRNIMIGTKDEDVHLAD